MKRNKTINMLLTLMCGIVFVKQICTINLLEIEHIEALSGMAALAGIVAYGGYQYFAQYKIKGSVLCYSFVMSVLVILGYVLRLSDGASVIENCAKNILAAAIAVTPAVAYIVCKILDYMNKVQKDKEKPSDKNWFMIYVGVVLVAWIPVFLAYYPGLFAYDVASQTKQIISGEYTTHHPLVHTLLLGFFYRIGGLFDNYNLGIVLYTLFQMIVLAMCMANALEYLRKKKINKSIRVIILLFFALCPINSVLAISVTKDVLFSAFVLLFLVTFLKLNDEAFVEKQKHNTCILIGTGVLIYLFRNNGKYVLFAWGVGIVLIMIYHKLQRKIIIRTICSLGVLLVIGTLFSAFLVNALDAQSGKINEMCSVPSVQMARCAVIMGEELDLDLKEAYEQLNIMEENYSLSLADGVKGNVVIKGQEKLFFTTWIKTICKYPSICIDAFMYLHSGNLFLEDVSNAYIYGGTLEKRTGYLLTDTKEGYGVTHESKFAWLEEKYERLFSANEYLKIPLVSTLFSLAFYIYMLSFCLLYCALSKNRVNMMAGLFLLLYYGTMLLGPCALIRYMYPIVISTPILTALAVNDGKCDVGKKELC